MEESRSRYRVPRPPIHQLSVGKPFDGLSQQEKLYAHHMARYLLSLDSWDSMFPLPGTNLSALPSAAWHGTRIILRQVSPESTAIFDFIMELYASCSGDWKTLVVEDGITSEECATFLEFAATFLSNVGNYYVCLPCCIRAMYTHAEI